MTKTEHYMTRLKRLAVGKSLALTNGDGAYGQLAIWRHAAKKLGQRIMIRTLPNKVQLHRLS